MSQAENLNKMYPHPSSPSYWPLAWLTGTVVIILAFAGYILYGIDEPGIFGDMFGAVNALFPA